jgi:hypothetical protein
LETMVAPRLSDRYTNAEVALAALQPIYVTRYPCVEFSHSQLEFTATRLGERITQTITVSNSTADTLLEGTWSIESQPNDSPGTMDLNRKWILFSSRQVKGNQVDCDITIDTSKLIAQASGTRSIVFRSNAVPDTHTIPLQIITAPLPIQFKKLPYEAMIVFLLFAFGCGRSLNLNTWDRTGIDAAVGFIVTGASMLFANQIPVSRGGTKSRIRIGIVVGGLAGMIGGIPGCIAGATFGGLGGLISSGTNAAGSIDGSIVAVPAIAGWIFSGLLGGLMAESLSLTFFQGAAVGSILGINAGIIGYLYDAEYSHLPKSRTYKHGFIFLVLETIAIFGMSLGILHKGMSLFALFSIVGSSIGLAYFLIYLPSQQFKEIAAYRQRQKNLIKL